jgi:hypothetical protein
MVGPGNEAIGRSFLIAPAILLPLGFVTHHRPAALRPDDLNAPRSRQRARAAEHTTANQKKQTHEPAAPMTLWRKTRIGPKMSVSGWKMLARTMIALLVDQPAGAGRVVGPASSR